MFLFELPKHIALKMVSKSIYVVQNTFINSKQPQLLTGVTKIEKLRKKRKMNILGSKTPKIDLLTLNYGLPSNFTTSST